MGDQCPLCERHRERSAELCEFHSIALANFENAYASWRNAYGSSFTKKEYFATLETLDGTGQAVKDVIQYLRKKGVER